MRVFTKRAAGEAGGPNRSFPCVLDGVPGRWRLSRAPRGRDRRPARGEMQANANASYVQGGWRVVVVVFVVVVDVVDLVVGRARAWSATAAAASKCLERVHEAEARRVEDAIFGRPFEILFFGVARAPRLAQIDLRALRAGGLPGAASRGERAGSDRKSGELQTVPFARISGTSRCEIARQAPMGHSKDAPYWSCVQGQDPHVRGELDSGARLSETICIARRP